MNLSPLTLTADVRAPVFSNTPVKPSDFGPRRRSTSYASATPVAIEALERRRLLSADLTGAFTAIPASFAAGGEQQVTLQLVNSGTTAARGSVRLSLYASGNGKLDSSATFLTGITKQLNLKPGHLLQFPVRLHAPITLADGTYTLIAQLGRSGGAVATSTVISSGPVQVVQPYVDLTSRIARLPARPIEIPAAGLHAKPYHMTIDVTNQGTGVANGQVTFTVYLAEDGSLDSGAIPVKVSLPSRVRIEPGKTVPVTVNFTPPSSVAAGSYYVLAQVKATRGIAERNSDNNLAVSASPVEAVPAPPRRGRGYEWCFANGEYIPYYYDDGIDYYAEPGEPDVPPESGDTTSPSGPDTGPSGPDTGPTTGPTTTESLGDGGDGGDGGGGSGDGGGGGDGGGDGGGGDGGDGGDGGC